MATDQQLPFAPGALVLDGFFLLRATVQPTAAADERTWLLDLVHRASEDGTPPRFYLFANLQAVQGGWLIGSTVGGRLHLPDGVDIDQMPPDAFKVEYRRLFEETLWDAASSHARQLCAMGRVEDIVIPASCPRDQWAKVSPANRKQRAGQAAS